MVLLNYVERKKLDVLVENKSSILYMNCVYWKRLALGISIEISGEKKKKSQQQKSLCKILLCAMLTSRMG